MPSPSLSPELRKLLKKQQLIAGTSVPAYRLLDVLATEDGDVPKLIIYFKDMKEPAMRRAFHEMAELLRALDKEFLAAPESGAPKARKAPMKQDVEALKAASHVKVFLDGASKGNPGPSAAAYVIADSDGNPLYEQCHSIGVATNNVAEYRALIAAMETLLRFGKRSARFFSDSERLVNQVSGLWKIKKPELARLVGQAVKMRRQFERFSLSAIPREQNRRADFLASSILKPPTGEKGAAGDG
ncbi:MAG: ribonuclease HI family protein, partial [Candidatus Sumerlaeota bacterium]|nr:ribonuclease HI family protein [Candidatus Sumerlaeota bacterium]